MDRTVATGTGYIGQYPAPLAATYESLATCPDDLLLFMHHVPYTYRLHSGLTVMQTIDNTHYWGARAAAEQVFEWEALRGKVPDTTVCGGPQTLELSGRIGDRLAGCSHALVYKGRSGIPDALGRVDHYPNRIEAESMTLTGYDVVDVTPWETASGSKAVICNLPQCAAQTTWTGPDGWYDISVQYFDLLHGHSRFFSFDRRS